MENLKLDTSKKPTVDEAVALYVEAGWGTNNQYDYNRFESAFKNSHFVTAYVNDNMVGFVRYLTDGAHETIVNEFLVSKSMQKKGIGTALLEKLTELHGNTDIYISTPKEIEPFFLKNGMGQQQSFVQVSRRGSD